MRSGARATKSSAQDGFWPDITLWTSSPTVYCTTDLCLYQIITEVWTEPQDGRVVNHPTMAGLASKDIAARLFPRDLEVMLIMMMMMTMMIITMMMITMMMK